MVVCETDFSPPRIAALFPNLHWAPRLSRLVLKWRPEPDEPPLSPEPLPEPPFEPPDRGDEWPDILPDVVPHGPGGGEPDIFNPESDPDTHGGGEGEPI